MQVFGAKLRRRFLTIAWIRASTVFLCIVSSAAAEQTLKVLLQQAFDFHQRAQYSLALPLLRRAHQLDSRDYFVNLLLGIDLLRTGEPKESLSFLKMAANLRPKEEYPLAYIGEAWARQKLYGEAAEAYLKAVQVAPGYSESSVAFVDFALARVASVSGSLRGSQAGLAAEYRLRAVALQEADISRRQLLEHAADLDPTAPGVWTDLARVALAESDTDAAEQYLRRALQQNVSDLAAWLVDAQLAAQRSDWKRAVERISAAEKRSPFAVTQAARAWPPRLQAPASVLTGAATRFFSCVGQSPTACKLPIFKLSMIASAAPAAPFALYGQQRWEALARLPVPTQPESWLQRGVAFARLEDCQRAIPALERGLQPEAPDVYGRFLLAWCYSREAGQVADQVHATEGDVAVRLMRGDILLRLRADAPAAISEYQAALLEHPNDPAVLERLADAQFGAGKIDDARQSAQSALQRDPQRLAVKRTLARIAMQERDYATALPYLREFVASSPTDAVALIELGTACAQTGALDEAWRNLAPVLDRGYPDEKGSLHSLLANVLKKMGRTQEADKEFSESQRLSDAFQQKSYRDRGNEKGQTILQENDAQP